MFNKKNIIILIISIALYIFFRRGVNYVAAEDLAIPSGIAVDIIKDTANTLKYSISISTYNFNSKKENSSSIYTGVDRSVAGTREDRQSLLDKKFILGLERVQVYSEEVAKNGVGASVNALFNNPNVNDTSVMLVCEGKAIDILKHKVTDYSSSTDYVEGMVQHANEYNFFSDNYKLMDIYVRMYAEGRSVVLPYISIKNDQLAITGMALFNKDKMATVIDIDDTKLMNLLRENKVRGTITLEKYPNKYVDYQAASKRKVKCDKKDDKYTFYIDLDIKGDITNNTLYKTIFRDPYQKKEFEQEMGKKVEEMCNEFLVKMKNEYKVDCLELGSVAAAKYGRNKDIDWNDVVCKSDIKVRAKVKVTGQGRGDY